MSNDLKKINKEIYNKEALLCGVLWNNPPIFDMYDEDKLSSKIFGNRIWGFYVGLGRHLHKKGYETFDELTIATEINELNLKDKYDRYNGYSVIEELCNETKDSYDNFNALYDDVKKYAVIRELYKVFGGVVLQQNGNYDIKKLSKEVILAYWMDRINSLDVQFNDTKIEAEDLLSDMDEVIEMMDSEPDLGMPLYRGRKLTDAMSGWAEGTLSIVGSFSGRGKSSFTLEKFILSCIVNNEKVLIVANEMDKLQYQKLLLVTIMGCSDLYERYNDYFDKHVPFNRKRIHQGNFDTEEKLKLAIAVDWIKEITKNNKSLVKLVALEDYTMDNVEKAIRKYHMRGYSSVIVDTAKPTTDSDHSRWERFYEDFERLYRITRKNGGGLGLRTLATVQLADTCIGDYFLDETALADSKKIKNVADFLLLCRPVFDVEYENERDELQVHNYIKRSEDIFNQDEDDGREYIKQKVKLKKGKIYYLFFVAKNRRGQTNETGLLPIVYEVDFNSNRWKEIGWATNVKKEKGRRW